jgi:hypothetical protein
VAQLGARFHGMEEVVGSIPTRSTKISQQLREVARWMARRLCPGCVITRCFGALFSSATVLKSGRSISLVFPGLMLKFISTFEIGE